MIERIYVYRLEHSLHSLEWLYYTSITSVSHAYSITVTINALITLEWIMRHHVTQTLC